MSYYVCGRCNKKVTLERLIELSPRRDTIEYRCPHCGYRILYKPRRPVAKVLKAI